MGRQHPKRISGGLRNLGIPVRRKFFQLPLIFSVPDIPENRQDHRKVFPSVESFLQKWFRARPGANQKHSCHNALRIVG
jgi:hypothetical protein